jgi:hypothetical protein
MITLPEVGDIILMTGPKEYHLITKKVNKYMYETLALDYGYHRQMSRSVLIHYPWVKVS